MLYTVRPHSPQSTAPQSKGNSKKDKNEFSLSLSLLSGSITRRVYYIGIHDTHVIALL